MSTTVSTPPAGSRIPLPVWVIGGAIFAQGTSELMLAGLLPEVSADLNVTIPHAGLLVSVFALGMFLGAPALAVALLRVPRRTAMIGLLAAFAAGHVASALTDSFTVLLVLRFVSAIVYAGFWAVGAAAGTALVAAERRGRAMSVVAGGLTLASVVGLPLGTWLGQQVGWRGAFWAVAAASAVAMLAVAALVPETRPDRIPALGDELRGLAAPRLWLSYAMTAAATAALIGTFTYLGAMLITDAGASAGWVPIVLFGYGAGGLTAMVVGGMTADRLPRATLVIGFTALLAVLAVMSLSTGSLLATGVLAIVLGFAGFGTNPALNSRNFTLAPSSPTLIAAGSTSAFNVGIAAGPWLAGLSISAGNGYPSVPLIGVGLAALALLLLGFDAILGAREQHGAAARSSATAPVAVCAD